MHAGAESVAHLAIEEIRVGAFTLPTDAPESDGTLAWRSTTLIVVELAAGAERGLGYTYANAGVARTITDQITPLLRGRDGSDIPTLSNAIHTELRNLGCQGPSAMAASAVDTALWDLKARHLGLPLFVLLGAARHVMPVYGSGGFTSYSDAQLQRQFADWSAAGVTRFKMKVGRDPARDRHRVRAARAAIGDRAELMVDANSAYTRPQALEFARIFADEAGVRWLEEPLPPDDFDGLRFLRDRVPAGVEIAEGEYGYDLNYFRRLLEADAIDVVMADATRCGGVSGFMKAAVLCEAWNRPLSSHCAPALHVHLGCAAPGLRHAEYFHDHARIERELFAGMPELEAGALRPDPHRSGLGLEFKWAEAKRYAV